METGGGPVEAKLQEIHSSPVTARWIDENTVKLDLPHNCRIRGALIDKPSGREMFVSNFQLDAALQRHGIGQRLLKSLTAIAKSRGARYLTGHVISEAALKTRARIVGEDNMQFFEPKPGGGGRPLHITYQEALEQGMATGGINYEVSSDLSGIDTANWELPQNISE